jgi:glycosyltransferase involved in cell wall biosynthesis
VRVGLNMLHLVPGETGGSELYARRLVPALLEAGDPTLTVLAPTAALESLLAEPWGRDVDLVGIPFDARSRVRRALAEQTRLRGRGIDLLHNLFTTAPAFPGVPQVTTILDVIYKRFPETHAGLRARGLAVLTWIAAHRSKRIIAISEAGKGDIVRFLGVASERVDVTYPGPALPPGELDESIVRASLGLGEAPIVLTVSAKLPHKNLERLFEAFAGVQAEPAPVLVVPGYETFHEPALRERAAALVPGRIRFTGWLEDEALDGLFRASACFVFPSLAEGFGLPVLDALARGVPVASSDASSLPEVGGDAVLYFDPNDTGAMTTAISRLLEDEALRNRLRAAGPEQAGKFSWAKTAEDTLASYERALAAQLP